MVRLLIGLAFLLVVLFSGGIALLAREVNRAPLSPDYYLAYRYTMNGALRTRVINLHTPHEQAGISALSSCAPNGRYLVVFSNGVYIISEAERQQAALPFDNVIIDGITVSNTGEVLISMTRYENRQTPQYLLYRADFTGGNLIELPVPGSRTPRSPQLAPDGRRIALMSGMPQNVRQVRVLVEEVDAAGSVPSIAEAWSPAWSPAGDMIAFIRQADANYQVFIKDMRTLVEMQVTHDDMAKRWPVWSPDGQQLLYLRSSGFQSEVYAVALDGSMREQVFLPESGSLDSSIERVCFLTFQPDLALTS